MQKEAVPWLLKAHPRGRWSLVLGRVCVCVCSRACMCACGCVLARVHVCTWVRAHARAAREPGTEAVWCWERNAFQSSWEIAKWESPKNPQQCPPPSRKEKLSCDQAISLKLGNFSGPFPVLPHSSEQAGASGVGGSRPQSSPQLLISQQQPQILHGIRYPNDWT